MTLQPLLQASPVIQLHVAAALATFLCGVWLIFMSRKGAPRHRVVGRMFLAFIAATALLSFFIHRRMPHSPVFGLSPTHLLAVFVLFCVWKAWDAARKGDVRRHRFWATGLFGGAIVINELANIFLFTGISHDVFFSH